MIRDVSAVVWKEAHELLAGAGRGKYAPLILLAIYGVFIPLQAGKHWVDSYTMIFLGMIISVFMVLSIVADTFAGERERHTLETLLASRLSDRAILVGKMTTVVIYSWGLTIASLLIGLIAVNLTAGGGKLLLYPANRAVAVVVISLLMAILASGVGVLVSLRASTVRQAQQQLTIGWVAITFAVAFGFKGLSSQSRSHLLHWFNSLSLVRITVGAVVVLILIDLLVLAIDAAKFQRSRLILD